jgi:hypothetical protein
MTLRKSVVSGVVVLMALALAATGFLLMAQKSSATHVRPKGASPVRVPFVIAYQACTTGANTTHGTPLAFPSCNPPVQASNFLTVGTPDANTAAANATGFAKLDVHVGVPGPPDDSDVNITADATDVRCKAATAATVCNSANAADGPDYSGQLQGNATIRITDHYNGANGTTPATVQDIGFPVVTSCTNTADTSIGAHCVANTSANAVVPGSVKDGKRATVEISQLQVSDGGADGVVQSTDNTLFAVQGLFIP